MKWLTLQERQCGVHHQDTAPMFTDFRKELETLAKAIANQESDVVGRVEVMSGGAVLSTALFKWLKDPRDLPRAWRQGINLRSTALRGTTSEPCGKRSM